MDLFQQDQLSNLDIEIDSEAKNSLDNAAYWGKFISILVMSFVAIILLVLAVANTAFMNGFKQSMGRRFAGVDEFGSGFLLIAFFIIFILLGLIYYFLYNFSVKVKNCYSSGKYRSA
ncbi:MAG: hypothetical protein IPP48_00675 [Chitinophagaceae bacterium]|nr:hypothetical protein [Chitinophagaceae bacterium]